MLALHILKDMWEFKANLPVVVDRPCVYGVLDSPIGGMAPRPQLCVGCLRCTTQNPETIQIHHNPAYRSLGDSYMTYEHIANINFAAETGSIPVKGAGYRGKFGGTGWDSIWTDMSEIVRPTRDGIHGREFIATMVDIGAKPDHLHFDAEGALVGEVPQTITTSTPFLFDVPPAAHITPGLFTILSTAAEISQTLTFLPAGQVKQYQRFEPHIVPVFSPGDDIELAPFVPRMVEVEGTNQALFATYRDAFPESVVALRMSAATDPAHLIDLVDAGVRVFHLIADYHGQTGDNFILESIRVAHTTLVEAGVRDQVTLLGSGGMVAAEHVAKAIICGLDAVALDTPLLVAMDGRFNGECTDPTEGGALHLPQPLPQEWAVQRLVNLIASWHSQLLEVLGAMGMRDVRRLRGEMGRAMFQKDLEREAFGEINGYGEA